MSPISVGSCTSFHSKLAGCSPSLMIISKRSFFRNFGRTLFGGIGSSRWFKLSYSGFRVFNLSTKIFANAKPDVKEEEGIGPGKKTPYGVDLRACMGDLGKKGPTN